MNNLCVIPARGGSKRIPRKNIKEFLGKPIIAYSIELALKSDLFSEVMVSTDDPEIAEVAKTYGAKVPFIRSKENSDDYATLSDVIDEVVNNYDKSFKFICCILPTAPLIQMDTLNQAFELLKSNRFHSVRPLVKFSYPIQRALSLKQAGSIEWFQPEYAKTRSQDLEKAYHDAGQFYWMKSENRLRSADRGGIIIDEMSAQDIDTLEDWQIAELKYKILTQS